MVHNIHVTIVFPARLYGKKETGGRIEVLLTEKKNNSWLAMIGGRNLNVGDSIYFSKNVEAKIVKNIELRQMNIQTQSIFLTEPYLCHYRQN